MRIIFSLPISAVVLLALSQTNASDWPQWRGPQRDGVALEVKLPAQWPEKLKARYRVEIGEGHAAPVIAGNRVYVFSREQQNEIVRCLDAETGKELWMNSYAAPYKVDPAAAGHGPGPKATPTFAEGKLYTLGMSSQLRCWDSSGKVLWQHDLLAEYQAEGPQYGTSASLLVEGDLVIALVGGRKQGSVIAFDRNSGKEKWKTACDGPAYGAPVAAELAGVHQVLTFTRGEFVSLLPQDGQILWRIPYTTAYEQNIVTPVVYQDLVIISGYSKPALALRIERVGNKLTAREAWKNAKLRMYMSSPVLKGDSLFGHDQSGQIVCVDAKTGATRWAKGNLGDYVSMILAEDRLLCLDDQAELTVLEADPTAYKEVAKIRVSDSPTWAHLALSGGRIFVKDKTHLICFELPA
jgi:outer membrane protein assembly factor BamB